MRLRLGKSTNANKNKLTHKTMEKKELINEACEWLKKEMRVEDCGECDRLVAADYADLEEFLKDFCKAISQNL